MQRASGKTAADAPPARRPAAKGAVAGLGLVTALLIWLYPFSLGTKMPVGGDVTQFFLGLMSLFSVSLTELRLPIWNDLWGYGFPGIGESQMGVFYPPHLILYGLLPVEHAYVASLVVHTVWGGLGAYWTSQKFGAKTPGAVMAGFAFAASGFFVIHLSHPWGYTTGAWLPWAWGLAWSILNQPGPGVAGRSFLLGSVLAIQILPGHFQIAFMTQATIVVMAFCSRLGRSQGDRGIGRRMAVLLTSAAALPLAAMQVWPTARLASLAADRRDFEYLSGFAATPFHLVSLIAPGLFHGSPLWRPLVWDPFHTSPEEYLAYLGLAPLLLAVMTAAREFRRDSAVQCLAVLGFVCLVLSLGPYVPGFGWLIQLPGFSFFRAPARWGLPMTLALAILAGVGLDRWRSWERTSRTWLLLAAGAGLWIVIVVGSVELALWSTSSTGNRAVEALYDRAFRLRPWEGDPDFRSVVGLARRPSVDPVIPAQLERAGIRRSASSRDPRSFEQRRWEIYREELVVTLLILAAVALAAGVPRFRDRAPALLLVLTILDLLWLGGRRYVDVGPLRPLNEQSPVLARLAREPHGTRVVDPLRNLTMAAGAAPLQAYRTLDLPVQPGLAALAGSPLEAGPAGALATQAMRAAGAGLRVLDPIEVVAMRLGGVTPPGTVETIRDETLARWMYGADWNEGGVAPVDFQIVRTDDAPHAWLAVDVPEASNGDPRAVLSVVAGARPLSAVAPSPVEWEVSLDGVDRAGVILLTVLYDPQWRAVVAGGGRADALANISPAFRVGSSGGAWMRIVLDEPPGPGAVLRLTYDPRDVRQGLWATGACWIVWLSAILYAMRRERRQSPAN